MLEKEYKFLLTREQYDALKEYFQWNNTFEQFNYYYNDMDNYIYNNNITVRIRERNGKFKLQTKMNVYNNGALAIKEEKGGGGRGGAGAGGGAGGGGGGYVQRYT